MKTFSLLVIALAAGVLPAADPTTKDAARAKAALTLAFATVPADGTPVKSPAGPMASAAKAALREAFGCDCEPCADPCPRKCGCEECAGNSRFPRPMEKPDAPKVVKVEPEKPAAKYRTEYREKSEPVRECYYDAQGVKRCRTVVRTVTEAVQVLVAD